MDDSSQAAPAFRVTSVSAPVGDIAARLAPALLGIAVGSPAIAFWSDLNTRGRSGLFGLLGALALIAMWWARARLRLRSIRRSIDEPTVVAVPVLDRLKPFLQDEPKASSQQVYVILAPRSGQAWVASDQLARGEPIALRRGLQVILHVWGGRVWRIGLQSGEASEVFRALGRPVQGGTL